MKSSTYALLLVIAILSAGCTWYTSGPPQGVAVEYDGNMNASTDGFSMHGEVSQYGQEQPALRNVTVYLYDDNETLIDTRRLGTLEDEPLPVTVRVDRLPKYVIFYSERFEDYDEIQLDYYEQSNHNETLYIVNTIGATDELPIVPEG